MTDAFSLDPFSTPFRVNALDSEATRSVAFIPTRILWERSNSCTYALWESTKSGRRCDKHQGYCKEDDPRVPFDQIEVPPLFKRAGRSLPDPVSAESRQIPTQVNFPGDSDGTICLDKLLKRQSH